MSGNEGGEVGSEQPKPLSPEEKLDELFQRGWTYSVNEESGTPKFTRSYPRINGALQGDAWREVIGKIPSILEAKLPDLPRGFGFGTHGKETELTIEILGDKKDPNKIAQLYALDEYFRESGFEEIDEAMLHDWLKLKGEPGAPKIGSKEYYEQVPRAAELRKLCIELIDNYRHVVISEGTGGGGMARILELNRQLAELEVDPNMHVGAPPVEFADPVKRAEWVAGLLRDMLQEGAGFDGNAKALLEEHDMLAGPGEGMKIIDSSSASEAPNHARLLMALDNLAENLDAAADKPDKDST